MDTMIGSESVSINDSMGYSIDYNASWQSPVLLTIKPEFEAGNSYNLDLDETSFSDFAGLTLGDSLRSFSYNTVAADTFGQVTGTIVNAPGPDLVVLLQSDKGDPIAAVCDAGGSFAYDRLFPGTYWLKMFDDANANGVFDGGKIRPFEFAESISIYGDSVQVRSRWETDLGKIDFGSTHK
jgi:hypothetical protein